MGDPSDFAVQQNERLRGQISLTGFVRTVWRGRSIFLAVTGLVTAISIVYALWAEPVYRSTALMADAFEDSAGMGFGELAGNFGGLAAMAGIDIGEKSRKDEAIALLESRSFIQGFIERNDLLPILFQDEWDDENQAWTAEEADEHPTMSDAIRLFSEDVQSVIIEPGTGFVQLSIDWSDRFKAAQWANQLVADLNSYVRERDIEEANRSIEVLREEYKGSSVVEVKQGIARLIEQQIQISTLARARQEYAFRILDKAVPADEDERLWPKRTLIVIVAFFFGLVLSTLFVLILNRVRFELYGHSQ